MTARFTADPVDIGNISSIMPLGNIVPGGVVKSHGYVVLSGNATNVPLRTPASSLLFRLAWYIEEGQEQWLLFFQVSCDVWFIVDHLDDVPEKIRAVAPAAPAQTTMSNNLPDTVAFEAGETIGFVHARGSGGAFDLGTYDARSRAPFADPARPRNERDVQAICAWDLYPPEKAAQYKALFARAGKPPTPGASCRSSSRDLAGSAAGQWFAPSGAILALAADLDGSVVVSGPGAFLRDEAPARDPAGVAIGEAACYQDETSHAWVKVEPEATLLFAAGQGACGADFPAAASASFMR